MDILNNLITNFSTENLIQFFRQNINTFKPETENFEYLFEDNESIIENFQDIEKIGEADINNSDDLIVIAAKTLKPLTDRTGKKRQFDIAKKILKEDNKDAAFFIFYDEKGNFRFSFIRANFLGTKRDFTDFKRYTYFVSPELTNNTFKSQISEANFNDLESILEAFSVEPLNKQFYEQIAASFYSLIGGKIGKGNKIKEYDAVMQLPGKDIKTDRKVFQEFAVRLIGRTIFVWFLKNKTSENNLPLIPEEWLTSEKVKQTANYYHTILEKLFFEILNKPADKRIKNLPDKHEIVPFLNGGLFEPGEDDFYTQSTLGAPTSNYALKIPDEWFFNLFQTLERFNFTIDENSINDMEVSIDPEMLGTIFENLLAEIDPDTEKSARKSTGSFYTPREIVDYMVEESLVSYLKQKTGTNEEILHNLFKENDLPESYFENKEKIINAFDEIKILDPACGSGAFPMGALHKINTALQKLDPDAQIWKDKQLSKIDNIAYRKALKNKLDKSNVEYIRKLGIIQYSIYGVDIQPIATEISKLRSFLSLVVDEKIDDNAENRGIYPLPNLEFKFVTANTLIDLHKDVVKSGWEGETSTLGAIDFAHTNEDIEKLHQIRTEYLQAYGKEKEDIKKQFISLQKKIAEKELASGVIGKNKKALQIIDWNPFKHEKSDWFNPKWMFGVEKFDIVIGNPPYVSIRTKSFNSEYKKTYKKKFILAVGQYDLFVLFIEKSNDILKDKGIMSFIIPTRFLSNETFQKARKCIFDHCRIETYLDAKMPFESANVEANAFIGIKNSSAKYVVTYTFDIKSKKISLLSRLNYKLISKLPFSIFPFIVEQKKIDLINKIISSQSHYYLERYLDITRGFEFGYNHSSITNKKNSYPLIKPEAIFNYTISEEEDLYVNVDFDKKSIFKTREIFKNTPKLLTKFISNDIIFALDKKGFVNTNVVYNCHLIENEENINLYKLLGWLNSKLVSFWFKITFLNLDTLFPHIQKNQLNSIIIPTQKIDWDFIEDKSKTIISKKEQNQDTTREEKEIDLMVYKLYDLTYEEVKIIEPEFEMSKKEYENYKLN